MTATITLFMTTADIGPAADLSYRLNDLAWLPADFSDALRTRHTIGHVVRDQDFRLVGFMVLEIGAATVAVLKLAAATEQARLALNAKIAQVASRRDRAVVV